MHDYKRALLIIFLARETLSNRIYVVKGLCIGLIGSLHTLMKRSVFSEQTCIGSSSISSSESGRGDSVSAPRQTRLTNIPWVSGESEGALAKVRADEQETHIPHKQKRGASHYKLKRRTYTTKQKRRTTYLGYPEEVREPSPKSVPMSSKSLFL